MFEKANRIIGDDNYGNAPRVYFKDLNIIYPLRRAVLHVTACGNYNIYVGKDKVGDGTFNPDAAEQYKSFDITELVAESDFLYISVSCGDEKCENSNHYPPQFSLMAQIDLEFAGNLSGKIVTDESWATCTVPVTNAEIEGGDVFDFTRLSDFTGKVKIV